MLFGEDWLAEQGLVLAGLLAAMLCLVFRHPLVLVILLLLLCPLALHQVGSPASPELAVLFIVLVFRVAGILWPAGQAADGRGNGACMLMVTGALLALRADEFIVLVAGVELLHLRACASSRGETFKTPMRPLKWFHPTRSRKSMMPRFVCWKKSAWISCCRKRASF